MTAAPGQTSRGPRTNGSSSTRASRHSIGSLFNAPVVFALPYLATLALLVIYPVIYGVWLGHKPENFVKLFESPEYIRTVINTVIFVGVAVNLKLLGALFLSGLFVRKTFWTTVLLIFFMLPWMIPSLPAYLSMKFMLNDSWGTLNSLIELTGASGGPGWLIEPFWAMVSVILTHVWKWLPFWTLIFIAARTAIPTSLYEAAALDGATTWQSFVNVTYPLVKPTYITALLLSTIWTLGDFNSVNFITGGGPAGTTEVLATLGIKEAFTVGNVPVGVAVALTAIPALIPLAWLLVRRLRVTGEGS